MAFLETSPFNFPRYRDITAAEEEEEVAKEYRARKVSKLSAVNEIRSYTRGNTSLDPPFYRGKNTDEPRMDFSYCI